MRVLPPHPFEVPAVFTARRTSMPQLTLHRMQAVETQPFSFRSWQTPLSESSQFNKRTLSRPRDAVQITASGQRRRFRKTTRRSARAPSTAAKASA